MKRNGTAAIRRPFHDQQVRQATPACLRNPQAWRKGAGAAGIIAVGLKHEEENFSRLIDGSDVKLDEVCRKAVHNWYMPADEVLKRRLVAGII